MHSIAWALSFSQLDYDSGSLLSQGTQLAFRQPTAESVSSCWRSTQTRFKWNRSGMMRAGGQLQAFKVFFLSSEPLRNQRAILHATPLAALALHCGCGLAPLVSHLAILCRAGSRPAAAVAARHRRRHRRRPEVTRCRPPLMDLLLSIDFIGL